MRLFFLVIEPRNLFPVNHCRLSRYPMCLFTVPDEVWYVLDAVGEEARMPANNRTEWIAGAGLQLKLEGPAQTAEYQPWLRILQSDQHAR